MKNDTKHPINKLVSFKIVFINFNYFLDDDFVIKFIEGEYKLYNVFVPYNTGEMIENFDNFIKHLRTIKNVCIL